MTKTKSITYVMCPFCASRMKVGELDGKILAYCEQKKCESILVFGDKVQAAWRKIAKQEYGIEKEKV